MNILKRTIFILRALKLPTIFRSIYYAFYRVFLEKKYGVVSRHPSPEISIPFQLEGIQPFHNGAFFSFNDGLQVDISFLSTESVRVTWSPGKLPLGYAVSGDETLALRVISVQTETAWELTAGSLLVRVFPTGKIEYQMGKKIFRVESPPVYQAPFWTHTTSLDERAVIQGLGERTRLNLRPGKYRLWNTEVGGNYGEGDDPLYLTIPTFYCWQPSVGYLAFYENSYDGEVEFDQDSIIRFNGGALRFYVMAGSLPATLEEYSRLTGKAPLPPRWALGFHHCRWGYQTSSQVRQVLQGFRDHDLPLDVFHFDIDYMDDFRVFSVDPVNYPDFDQLCVEMNADGIRPVVILDPAIKVDPTYGVYATGVEQGLFSTLPDGKRMQGLVWPGWAEFPDFTNPATRRWWGSYYARFLDDGVAGFWHDMNEPSAFTAFGEQTIPLVTVHNMEGRGGSHEEAHNLYGLLMNIAAFEAIRNHRPNQRPWLLTRSGWAGVQRYAWSWTGDVESTWEGLQLTIRTILGLGISGIPYSGSDIGGFSGSPDAELYTRWFQLSTLMAFFRNHSSLTTNPREPWVFGEITTDIIRKMLLLRKRLLPFLYTLAWEARHTGAPFVRPLTWLFPDKAENWLIEDQYLLGDKLLVAPVCEPGARSRTVRFPRGGWYHFWDDSYFPQAGEVNVAAPIDQIPFFVREGSVLPLKVGSLLEFHIYFSHSRNPVVSHHFEDAGDGYGVFRADEFHLRCNGNHLSLVWEKEGDYHLPAQVKLVFHGGKPDVVHVDGREIHWENEEIKVEPFAILKAIIQ